MGPDLGPQGKLEGLCVGSLNNWLIKFAHITCLNVIIL